MKTETCRGNIEMDFNGEAGVAIGFDCLNINSDFGTQLNLGVPDHLIASNTKIPPSAQTSSQPAIKPHKRKFYNYMHLNPIVLKTIEQVTGKKFIKPSRADKGEYPELTEIEADTVLRRLKNKIPRQPDCAVKQRFKSVSREYCAGVIDGEAHVSTVSQQIENRRYPGYRLLMCIGQNHHEMLQAVQNSLGANSGIYSPRRRIGQNRQVYDLKFNGVHVIAALAQVYPHLIRKKALAVMLLKMYADGRIWEHVGTRGVHPVIVKRRAQIHAKIKRMD